jgi:hypothetical protein
MTGIAALALCVGFTSCSHDLDVPSPEKMKEMEAQKIVNNYQKAFTATFGKVAANQTWGFGSASTRTRADGEWANYHGEYADANLWTSKGFHAPDALTPGQKLRVQFYFQTVKNPGGTHDYGTIDFFMQQVYDGATDPITDYSSLGYTSPTYSLEVYPAANGIDFIQSGEHMDHLVAGDNNTMEHINNFNNGNFPDPIPHVANWNQTVQDDPNQEHEDQIMLMINTPTQYFSYANSSPSKVRKDRWTLVSGEVIDNYCDNVNNSGWTAFLNAHSGVEDDPCYDEWERSYIGFDFDMLPSEDLYATIGYDAYGNIIYDSNQTPARTEFVYFGIPFDGKNQQYIWNGTELVSLTSVGEIGSVYGQAYFYPYKKGTTEKINVLTEKGNMYCGVPETWEDNQGKYVYTDNGTSYLRVDHVYQALDDMKMPVKDNHRKWVTIGKCNDGYYSDWIVSFLPAEPTEIIIEDPTEYSIRVMAEDLSASEASDFDFNDVVFDVTYNTDDANATVTLKAAGGTLPLIVAVDEPADDQDYTNNEVHHLFGEATNIMINTGRSGNDGANGKTASQTISVPFSNINSEDDFLAAVKNIKIWVKKSVSNGDGTTSQKWFELYARSGEACCKFACDPDFDWCPERTNIDKVYNFSEWVQGFSTTLVPRNNQ